MPKTAVVYVASGHIDERIPTAINWVTSTNTVDAGSTAPVIGRRKRAIFVPATTPPANERFPRFNRSYRIHRASLVLHVASNTLNGQVVIKQVDIQGSYIVNPSWINYENLIGTPWKAQGGDRLSTLCKFFTMPSGTGIKTVDITKTVACERYFKYPSNVAFMLETDAPTLGQCQFYTDDTPVQKPTINLTYTPVKRRGRTRRGFVGRASRL